MQRGQRGELLVQGRGEGFVHVNIIITLYRCGIQGPIFRRVSRSPCMLITLLHCFIPGRVQPNCIIAFF